MIQLFDVQDRKLVPTVHCYALPFLKKVIEQFPDDYIDVYKYIFYMTCPDSTMNPCVNLPELEKEEWITAELKPKFWVEDMVICEAVDKCKKLYETPSLRAYMGAKKALDRVADYLAETEITDGKEGSSMTIDRYMSKLSDYRKAYKDAESDLKEEQAKVRGNVKIRYDQLPNYKNIKEDEE